MGHSTMTPPCRDEATLLSQTPPRMRSHSPFACPSVRQLILRSLLLPPSFPRTHHTQSASAKSLFCKWSCRPSCLLDVACMSAFQYVIRAFKSVLHCWENILCTMLTKFSSLFLIMLMPSSGLSFNGSCMTPSLPVTLQALA